MGWIEETIGYALKNGTVSNSAITIGGAPFDFSAAQLKAAAVAVVIANANGIAITWEGTDPTATKGLPIAESGSVKIEGNTNVNALKFIRLTDDATVTVILEK